MEQSTSVRVFRLIVLALIVFYFLTNFLPHVWINEVGWRWRYLTNWAQALSLIVAILMFARSFGFTTRWPDGLVSATVVMNIMVVGLYWQLYFTDPTSVNEGGIPPEWWREFYIHLIGPILQWIDAFVIFGCFRRLVRTLTWLVGLILGYVLWLELILHPFSSSPVGTVTNGFPYPFLNDMELTGRLGFYGETLIQALVVMALGTGIAFVLRRFAGLGRE